MTYNVSSGTLSLYTTTTVVVVVAVDSSGLVNTADWKAKKEEDHPRGRLTASPTGFG